MVQFLVLFFPLPPPGIFSTDALEWNPLVNSLTQVPEFQPGPH